jgi:hypothetical protein
LVLPAISGPALLQTSDYIINVVTGIINEPQTRHHGIYAFHLKNPKLHHIFWADTSVDIALTGQLYDKLIQPVYF